jgi:ABC-type dipeptide/oligopeptide/nickel transport system permease subunit
MPRWPLLVLLAILCTGGLLGLRPSAHRPSSLIEWATASDADRTAIEDRLLPPLARTHSGELRILGTDQLGRPLALRLCLALGTSLAIAGIGALVAVALGTTVGTTAAMAGGRIDNLLMRSAEVTAGMPAILVIMVLVAALKPWGLWVLFAAMGLLFWQGIARVVRARVLRLRGELYVEAAIVMGAGRWHRLWHHILPGAWPTVLTYGSLLLPKLILLESLLAYLGVGAGSAHSFGRIISGVTATLTPLSLSWWPVIVPCTALALFVLILNLTLDASVDALAGH